MLRDEWSSLYLVDDEDKHKLDKVTRAATGKVRGFPTLTTAVCFLKFYREQ